MSPRLTCCAVLLLGYILAAVTVLAVCGLARLVVGMVGR